jgi:hypothetical protein
MKITSLDLLVSTAIDGTETLPVVKGAKTWRARLADLAAPMINAVQQALTSAQAAAATAGAAAAQMTYVSPYTVALASAAAVPGVFTALMTAGYAAAGDGGQALYRRVASQPAHPGKFRSTDRYLPGGTTDATNGAGGRWLPKKA